ncbi:chalcone isomerase family protein [Pseudomonas sp. CCOS 191]|uniref:chalcone isomerase family protein n=1 Tax=Pseudomonas sp. CCOS 191 TaxID=1649877 RepID=UPI0018E6C9DB|nr:chalcone isomerase family protein [Pseudomonas sp. CCOS 191]MBI6951991.1 chalcone isomerase family protein [Pseudomonas sp. CCOS 191]
MAFALRLACFCLLLTSLASIGADWRATLPAAQRLGEGEFTWFGLRLYSARLWAEGPLLDWGRPFALELAYHRSLSRDTLVKASIEEMRRLGAGSVTAQQLDAWTGEMQAAFVDVRPGMRITGVYLPQAGCRFYVDGRLRREVADVAFARAFFAIWLDPRARDPQLRQRLLGLAGNDRGQ